MLQKTAQTISTKNCSLRKFQSVKKIEDITTPFNISEVHFKQHNGIIAEVTVECEGKSVVAIAAEMVV